jgi:hypothetical protein
LHRAGLTVAIGGEVGFKHKGLEDDRILKYFAKALFSVFLDKSLH